MVQFVAGNRGVKRENTANAVHILVKTEAEALALLAKLQAGADGAKLARQHSLCPSGKKGGSLGDFKRGQMVAVFDKAIFSAPIRTWQGPIKTQFGYHLYKVLYRR